MDQVFDQGQFLVLVLCSDLAEATRMGSVCSMPHAALSFLCIISFNTHQIINCTPFCPCIVVDEETRTLQG